MLEGEPILFQESGADGLEVILPEGGRITLVDGAVLAERIEASWSLAAGTLTAEATGDVRFQRGGDQLGSHRLEIGLEGIRFSGGVEGGLAGVRLVGDALEVSADGSRFRLESGTLTGEGFRLEATTMEGAVDQSDLSASGLVLLEAEQEGRPSLLCLADNLVYQPAKGVLEAWPAEVSLGDGVTLVADRVVVDVATGGLHAEGRFRLEVPEGWGGT